MASNNSTTSKEENEQPKASEIIANNYDLATQILLRTPPASISNLKFTSKLWHSISIDPTFIRNHTRHHPLAPSGLLVYYYCTDFTIPPHHGDYKYVELKPSYNGTNKHNPTTFAAAQYLLNMSVLQSCNGLLLCCAREGCIAVCYYVCNPTTLQRKRIEFPKDTQYTTYYGFNLAFDPRVSSSYKIVFVHKAIGQKGALHRRKWYQVQVYSSRTGHWRKVGEPFLQLDKLNLKSGVLCKGSLHWLTHEWDCRYFDLNHECMKSAPKPQQAREYSSFDHEYFGESNDKLYLINKRHIPNYTLFQMMEDYSGWFVKCVVNLDVLSPRYPIMGQDFNFSRQYETCVLYIGDVKGGNGVDESDVELVICLPGKIVRFNPRTNALTEVGDHDRNLYGNSIVHAYFETICPV